MADVWAITNGNWSNTAIWNTGSLPATIDNVYSNNFTVYVDISPQVNFVTNLSGTGITAGGRFILNDTISLTANVIGGGANQVACVQFLSASPAFCTIYGSLCAVNTTISGPRALLNNSSGTVTVYGNGLGRIKGTGNPADGYIQNQSTGTINLFGNYIAGINAQVDNRGIWNQAAGTINLVGNLSGGVTGSSQGIYNNSTGVLSITGDIIANFGEGLRAVSTGTSNVVGNVFSTNSIGLNNTGSGTINLRGNLNAGNSICASNGSSGTINVIGNIKGGTASAATGISNSGSGVINVVGNSTGGNTTNTHGISLGSTGTVNITGNCFGGTSGTVNGLLNAGTTNTAVANIFGDVYGGPSSEGARNSSDGRTNIFGNCYGNIFTGGNGVSNTSTGTVNIIGSCFGGTSTNTYGARNTSTGTILISGSAIGGSGTNAYGALNELAGILRVKRAVGNGWGLGYTTAIASVPGVFSSLQVSQTFVEELECGPRGQWPTGGVIFFTPNPKAISMFETDTFQSYSLIQSNSADNLVPPVSSVRQGEVYDLGMDVGTCIIPPVSSVAAGALVDNLTGTAVLTPPTTWNYPTTASDVDSMGGRLRNALNTNSANSLIDSFNP